MELKVTTDKLRVLGITPNEYAYLLACRLSDPYLKQMEILVNLDKLVELGYLIKQYDGNTTTDFFVSKLVPDVGIVNEWFEQFWNAYPEEGYDKVKGTRPLKFKKDEAKKIFILKFKNKEFFETVMKCLAIQLNKDKAEGTQLAYQKAAVNYLKQETWKDFMHLIDRNTNEEIVDHRDIDEWN